MDTFLIILNSFYKIIYIHFIIEFVPNTRFEFRVTTDSEIKQFFNKSFSENIQTALGSFLESTGTYNGDLRQKFNIGKSSLHWVLTKYFQILTKFNLLKTWSLVNTHREEKSLSGLWRRSKNYDIGGWFIILHMKKYWKKVHRQLVEWIVSWHNSSSKMRLIKQWVLKILTIATW